MTKTKAPMRRCIGCMTSHPQKELIRVVCRGDSLMVDATGRAEGRGVYLCRNEECISRAKKSKSFGRSYKRGFEEAAIDGVLEEALAIVKEVANV